MAFSKGNIAKNSILLYIRMLITMCISLYTSRAILSILGVTDYGIYNVVGGVVTVVGFVNGSLAGASTRFITFTIGCNDRYRERQTFSTLLNIHKIAAVLLIVIVEIVGVWFLYNKMNVPANRINAAFWVLQCSLLTTAISLISVPYNSVIIAHERMDAFAYISVFEYTAKLGVVYLLLLFGNADRLIVYAVLICIVQIFVRLTYRWFVVKKFRYLYVANRSFDWTLTKEIAKFIGWKINGDLAFIGCNQGLNIVLNLFFGPVVNAARGISVQVQNLVNTFVQNYQIAVQPQIIKSYAAGELNYMQSLIIACSKYGFYLMLIVAYPILNYTQPILTLWLENVPDYTVFLVQIIILVCFTSPLRQPLIQAINATGNIKRFQIYEGTILLLAVPLAYIELKYFSFTLQETMISYLCIEYIAQIARIWIVVPSVEMKFLSYFLSVLFPICKVLIVLLVVSLIILPIFQQSTFDELLGIIMSEFFCVGACLLVGMKKAERNWVILHIKRKLNKNGQQ